MKTRNHIRDSLIIGIALFFMHSSAMATANFQFIQHSFLIGHNAGVDGFWGTADDDNSFFTNTTTGSASFSYATGVFLDHYSGSFSVTTPKRSPGTTFFTSMTTNAESGRVGSLKLTSTRTVTYTSLQRFVSTVTTSSSSGDFTATGVAGYALINRPGLDDPSVFGIPNLTTHFNLMKTLVPSNWTMITVEFQAFDGNYPTNGIVASAYSTDPLAIPNYSTDNNSDANGDGKADILLEKISTGGVWQFQMNGSSINNSSGVTTLPSGWDVEGTGDFNGDGKTDILLENSSTGLVWMFQMNGASITSSNRATVLPSGWSVVEN